MGSLQGVVSPRQKKPNLNILDQGDVLLSLLRGNLQDMPQQFASDFAEQSRAGFAAVQPGVQDAFGTFGLPEQLLRQSFDPAVSREQSLLGGLAGDAAAQAKLGAASSLFGGQLESLLGRRGLETDIRLSGIKSGLYEGLAKVRSPSYTSQVRYGYL